MKTPEGRLSAVLFASAIGVAACSGSSSGEADSSTSAAASASAGAQVCHNGDVIDGPGGTKLYCEELQASSANVFRDVTDLFNSQIPEQLHVGQTVLVRCVQAASLDFAPSANGNHGDPYSEWYVLERPDNFKDGLTAANDFWNVDDETKAKFIRDHTPLNQQPAVDPDIPSCGPPILE